MQRHLILAAGTLALAACSHFDGIVDHHGGHYGDLAKIAKQQDAQHALLLTSPPARSCCPAISNGPSRTSCVITNSTACRWRRRASATTNSPKSSVSSTAPSRSRPPAAACA